MSNVMAPALAFAQFRRLRLFGPVCLAAPILFLAMAAVASAQQSFNSADEAADTLVKAARADDERAVIAVLGRDGIDIISSGDAVADTASRKRFLAAYDAKHQVVVEGEDKAVMVIGDEDFPFPIPLSRKQGTWRFDTAAGRLEILYRRIGRNELDAIQACLAYVDAQNEYAEKDRSGVGQGVYAQRIISQNGKKDGLYWPASQGDDESPLGELVAQAAAEGYRVGGVRTPFHGYFYKILTRQGPNVPGGALDYVVRGKMIGGFALVAYPAEYGNSGVMTFMVNHEGTVFEKDLGPRTFQLAPRIVSFNPDQTWKKVTPVNP
jgi:hypothetical protein